MKLEFRERTLWEPSGQERHVSRHLERITLEVNPDEESKRPKTFTFGGWENEVDGCSQQPEGECPVSKEN